MVIAGKRVRLLEDHPDVPPGVGGPLPGSVDVVAVELDPTGELCARHDLVHPVQDPKECRFTATRRAR